MKAERGGFRASRHEQRHEQRLVGFEEDPYKPRRKVRGAARCADCGAVFRRGRWSWNATPQHAVACLCPACRRIRERLPAGFVTLKGGFFDEHRDEVLKRVRHCEDAQKREHPLQRIMAVEARGGALLVTTTDPHLARRIGEALHRAYKGELDYRYNKQDKLLRVSWSR